MKCASVACVFRRPMQIGAIAWPNDQKPCEEVCVRGLCVSEADADRCDCLAGFAGVMCEVFEGCPAGMNTAWGATSLVLPLRCEGVKCDEISNSRSLLVEVTNGGRYPSNATA